MKRVSSFIRMIAVSRIAMAGAAMTTTAVIAEFLVVIGELFFFESHPYIGIITYMGLPALFVMGLLLIPLGVFMRLRKVHEGYSLAVVEKLAARRGINVPHTLQVVLTLSLINVVIFAAVGYRGFHYTESVEFCGTVCHEVMHPEFETYSRSPHSQVACVQCHIGPGAQWFVKSKLSGARQFIAVLANTYSRPIETPVHNLRPARDVCEVCHRPDLFHGNLLRVRQHFEDDEENTRTFSVLNMRVGSGDAPGIDAHGIHWHVSKMHEVRYYATDRKRENIVWVEQV
ncbi:MAG: NapC/NirT family cytochrome c, partial [Planctomycetota bacterium]